jgi:hypothetical protein
MWVIHSVVSHHAVETCEAFHWSKHIKILVLLDSVLKETYHDYHLLLNIRYNSL